MLIPDGYEEIPEDETQLPLAEVLEKLASYGYEDCTEEANKQNGPGYESLYAFIDPSGHGVHYCSDEDDVRELLYTVE